MNKIVKGAVFSLGIALIAFAVNYFLGIISPIVLALAIGIIITNSVGFPKPYEPGINFTSKRFLEFSIILMGFGISFMKITSLGAPVLWIIILTILAVLVSSLILYRLMKCEGSTSSLIAFGTAICGTSAIAALAPNLKSEKSEIGISVAVINLLGLIGMISAPWLVTFVGSEEFQSILIGATLHGVGNVAGAGYVINENLGDLALTVKLGRVALLAPFLILYTLLLNKSGSWKNSLKLPYYLVGFILTSTLISLFDLPIEVTNFMRMLGKIFLTTSMAAIGLNIQFSHLYQSGKRALKMGVILFVLQIGFVILFSWLIL